MLSNKSKWRLGFLHHGRIDNVVIHHANTRSPKLYSKGCLHVKLKHAQNCPKLNKTGLDSFGQFGAIACDSHASFRRTPPTPVRLALANETPPFSLAYSLQAWPRRCRSWDERSESCLLIGDKLNVVFNISPVGQ